VVAGHSNVVAFQYFRPGSDLIVERQHREEAGVGEQIEHNLDTIKSSDWMIYMGSEGIWIVPACASSAILLDGDRCYTFRHVVAA
jgi:hypothetical protein